MRKHDYKPMERTEHDGPRYRVACGDAGDGSIATIMGAVAQTLDDESIQAIATWLSSLTPNRSL